ncbi:uncharacterized protein LOC134713854 [Mytilus trossulus]|uniref:uncharacterized protein LOC134713854 n=1 Tax=Mytilus trossulus TaxID=6551 RepID=UPI0030072AB2
MSLLTNLFTVCSLLFVYTGVIVGCIRKSDNSNPSKIDNEENNQIILENYRLSCSDNETKALSCLNGGSCFVVYVEDRIVKCACSNKYIGKRCEMIDPEIIFRQSENEGKDARNGFIIGFIVIIILLLIALFVLIYLKRCNQNEITDFQKLSELGRRTV